MPNDPNPKRKQMPEAEPVKYSLLSREQLIERLTIAEKAPKTKITKKQRKERMFNFEATVCRPVALRISYLGTNYHGFSSTSNDTFDTIESKLFAALLKAKLIPSSDACCWAKCGRTDKGVSAFGQTVSLYIRSTLPITDDRVVPWTAVREQEDAKHTIVKNRDLHTLYDFTRDEPELGYVGMLNRLLPEDIRVLCWSPVSSSFDARFSCTSRKYHYYFSNQDLDIPAMQDAAKRFEGTHDCRHICKIDTSKVDRPEFFVRSVLECKIEPVTDGFSRLVVEVTFHNKGKAFLWHQVRNMMALLQLVGEGNEQPSMIDDMLDLDKHPKNSGKPSYLMADDGPLVLVDCGFEENAVQWRAHDSGPEYSASDISTNRVLEKLSNQATISHLMHASLLQIFHTFSTRRKKVVKKHVSLMYRERSASVQHMIRKMEKKNVAKIE